MAEPFLPPLEGDGEGHYSPQTFENVEAVFNDSQCVGAVIQGDGVTWSSNASTPVEFRGEHVRGDLDVNGGFALFTPYEYVTRFVFFVWPPTLACESWIAPDNEAVGDIVLSGLLCGGSTIVRHIPDPGAELEEAIRSASDEVTEVWIEDPRIMVSGGNSGVLPEVVVIDRGIVGEPLELFSCA